MQIKKSVVALLSAGLMAAPLAHATNGMLMEGYGPISTGMGGASMAYDNGTAGMANNPATLGMMQDGSSRLDVALGGLHPDVVSKTAGMPDAKSGGTAYYMPAAGWVKKDGALTYGVGMFSQGGMGTEYSATDWVGAGSGRPSRSEVGIGNIIVPVAYEVSPEFTVGGSLDVVWSGMDLQMAVSAPTLMSMMGAGNLTVTAPPPTMAALGGFMGGGPANVGYFNFSDNSKFTGKAKSTGYAGKLGMTYKINERMTFGATYHSKTRLGDMTAGGATMELVSGGVSAGKLTGDVRIVNFQFPEVIGVGMSYKVNDDVMLAVDYKRIGWAKVMKDFHMTFVSPDMGGVSMDMKMPQNWVDQDVFNIGVAYRTSEALTLRAGMNLANNPVPNNTVNPLFPAIVKNHYMIGAGYALDSASELNGSLVYAPKVTVTAPATATSPSYTIDHSQTNWQMMYTHRF